MKPPAMVPSEQFCGILWGIDLVPFCSKLASAHKGIYVFLVYGVFFLRSCGVWGAELGVCLSQQGIIFFSRHFAELVGPQKVSTFDWVQISVTLRH